MKKDKREEEYKRTERDIIKEGTERDIIKEGTERSIIKEERMKRAPGMGEVASRCTFSRLF